jgi:hypothetical protein
MEHPKSTTCDYFREWFFLLRHKYARIHQNRADFKHTSNYLNERSHKNF